MAMLTNLKLRTKLFLAVLPLAVMVVVATVYSSVESQESDTAYSLLLDRGIETQKSLTATRALTMRFGMMLYQLIAESNPDRRQSIDGELDKTYIDYRARIAEALQQRSRSRRGNQPGRSAVRQSWRRTHVPFVPLL